MLSLILFYGFECFMNKMGPLHSICTKHGVDLCACLCVFQHGPRWSSLCMRVLRRTWVTRLRSPASTASLTPTTSPALSSSSGLWWVLLDPLRKLTLPVWNYPTAHVLSWAVPLKSMIWIMGVREPRAQFLVVASDFFISCIVVHRKIQDKQINKNNQNI